MAGVFYESDSMKRSIYLLALLALISITAGTLMAGATWIGRVGITFLHKDLNFLKIWWQGAIAVFLVYLLFMWIHSRITAKLSPIPAKLLHFLLLALAAAGLYLTWGDFHHTFSHRLMGRKFHLGFYLFWAGWMVICLYYMLLGKKPTIIAQDKTAQANG